MKANIDDTLTRLARRTHSPRGKYAASEQTYQSLLDRIPADQQPSRCREEQCPAIGYGARKPQQHTAFARWSAAACLLLVVGIGLAIAGVWYQRYYAAPSATESPSASEQAAANTLVYQEAPLCDIVAELSEHYHTPIQIVEPALRDYRITATFSTEESLTDILAILAEIGRFDVRETTEGFIIE